MSDHISAAVAGASVDQLRGASSNTPISGQCLNPRVRLTQGKLFARLQMHITACNPGANFGPFSPFDRAAVR
jgi:hypothetical protein